MKNVALSGGFTKRNSFASFIVARRNVVIEIISSLFILLFFYTAFSKTFQIDGTTNAIKKISFFSTIPQETAWAIVTIEYISTLLLFFKRSRKIGLYLSLALMVTFTIYIAIMMAFVQDLPCSCGGVISKMTWTQHLFFNLFFTSLALLGIWLLKKQNRELNL